MSRCLAERPEDDQLVEPVEELRPEARPQLVEHAQAHLGLVALSCHEVDGQGRLRDVPWAQLRFGSCSKGMRFCLFLLWYVPEIAIAKVLSWAVPIICRVCIVYLPVCI